MAFKKPDFVKLKDIGKNNLALILIALLFFPGLLVGLYLIAPKQYTSILKVQLRSSYSSLADNNDLEKELMIAMENEEFFTLEDIQYFKENLSHEQAGENTFSVTLSDVKKKRLTSYIQKASYALQHRLGHYYYEGYLNEKARLENLATRQTEEKTTLEEYFQTIDEEELQKEKTNYKNLIRGINNQISVKTKQLDIIEAKISSSDKKEKTKNLKIFQSKAGSLRSELDILKYQKRELDEKYNSVTNSLKEIEKTIEKIVLLEKSIEKNSKKLKLLNPLSADEKTGLIRIPYLYQAKIMEPPTRPKKVFALTTIKKRILIGLILSVLLVLLIFSYHLVINPVISSIEELEQSTNVPVIGAIYEYKAQKTEKLDT